MSKKWYIVRAVSGQENKVVSLIQSMKESGDFAVEVGGVHIPIKMVSIARKGKQYQQKRRLTPGYFLMELDMTDADWRGIVRQLREIDGFIGFASATTQNERPQPISDEEARGLLDYSKSSADAKKGTLVNYAKGEIVKIIHGPFSSFNGTIVEIVSDKSILRIEVEIFGRTTPIELNFDQVEKL